MTNVKSHMENGSNYSAPKGNGIELSLGAQAICFYTNLCAGGTAEISRW
jgi:hypothetical protein